MTTTEERVLGAIGQTSADFRTICDRLDAHGPNATHLVAMALAELRVRQKKIQRSEEGDYSRVRGKAKS